MTGICCDFSPTITNNIKVLALETTLQQGLVDFRELLVDFQNLIIESDKLKEQMILQQEKCNSLCCSGASTVKKEKEMMETGYKETIQAVASNLTKLNETKNFNIIESIFKILFNVNPKIENNSTVEMYKEVTDNEETNESVSEIEGTPTGRRSPIIQSKKSKTIVSSDLRDKKKCPDKWPTPEKKAFKLSFTTPTRGKNTRLRQSRLSVVTVKESNIIDITSSPEFNGGVRSQDDKIQIKKECLDNDDTILPSPTSGPAYGLFTKESPMKFKKPLSLKSKTENKNKCKKKEDKNGKLKLEPTMDVQIKAEKNQDVENNVKIEWNDSVTYTQENSINLLNPYRLPIKVKSSPEQKACDETTFCDTQASVSLLQHVDKNISPSKSPLAENININNVEEDLQSSISLLQRETKPIKLPDNGKRKAPDLEELLYEDAPRTKAEKRLQPGWSCEKCVKFFSELYKDNPELMAEKINACSHHRGAQNPERPKTPTNYWNPRWQVPEDTEEFNRKNNA